MPARKKTPKAHGGARPGAGRKPKPTDPKKWRDCWEFIDRDIAPLALAKLFALVREGDKDAIFRALRMAGFERPFEAAEKAANAADGVGGVGGGLSVTITSSGATYTSTVYPDKSGSSTSSSTGDGDTSR